MLSYKLAVKAFTFIFDFFFKNEKTKNMLDVRFNVWKFVWLSFVCVSLVFNVFITVKLVRLINIKHKMEDQITAIVSKKCGPSPVTKTTP